LSPQKIKAQTGSGQAKGLKLSKQSIKREGTHQDMSGDPSTANPAAMALHYSGSSLKGEEKMQGRDSSFVHENFSTIINDAKPYRNIIKRYWTEEEVR
jgi:hypothetical protein